MEYVPTAYSWEFFLNTCSNILVFLNITYSLYLIQWPCFLFTQLSLAQDRFNELCARPLPPAACPPPVRPAPAACPSQLSEDPSESSLSRPPSLRFCSLGRLAAVLFPAVATPQLPQTLLRHHPPPPLWSAWWAPVLELHM